jgi:hypothetical protein
MALACRKMMNKPKNGFKEQQIKGSFSQKIHQLGIDLLRITKQSKIVILATKREIVSPKNCIARPDVI